MVERLFRAHFTDGLNIADPGILEQLAAEIGVERNDEHDGGDARPLD